LEERTRSQISMRPLRAADIAVLYEWLNMPHVVEWWRPAPTLAAVGAKYTPRIAGAEPIHCLVASVSGKPVGMIQWYRVSDVNYGYPGVRLSPEAIAMDVFIGDPEYLGRGVGAAIVELLTDELRSQRAPYFVIDPDAANVRAIRAYARAGFRPLAMVAKGAATHVLMWKSDNARSEGMGRGSSE
jgi:aminoglycoside 6'-N-acetyltransferase